MRALAAILRKDIRLELRGSHTTVALAVLSILVLLVLLMAFSPEVARDRGIAAGALWVALVFSGMSGAAGALDSERENGSLRALRLAPVETATVYLAKLAASLIFMVIAEAATVMVLVLFFNLDFNSGLARAGLVLGLGIAGYAALATLLAAVSGQTRAGNLMLPVLIVPIFVPALIAGVKATSIVLDGSGFGAAAVWIKVIAAFDVIFVAAGYLMFEYVIGED